jgi:hypothetical protein
MDEPILISSAASRESINKDTRSILLHHFKDMLLPLQEATWASLVAAMVPSNLEHHHLIIINHHHLLLPQRPRHTNLLQMPTLHQLQPNSARHHHHHLLRRATSHMISDSILSQHIQQILHGTRVRSSTAGGRPALTLHRLHTVANFQLSTWGTTVLLIRVTLLALKALILLPLSHRCNYIMLSMRVSLRHLVLSPP